MPGNITEKQQRVYDYIGSFIEEKGYPPTVREIGHGVGGLAPATVKHHLEKLVRAEYISIQPGKTRSITLLAHHDKENSVPLLGNVAAGAPILADERVEEYVPYHTQGKSEEFFALRVRGESMLNAGIFPEDRVIVHKQEECRNGDIVVAIFEDEATVKTLKEEKGVRWLLPENDEYEPIDGTHARILGKVVGLVRDYN